MRGCMIISTEYTTISEVINNAEDIHDYSMQVCRIILEHSGRNRNTDLLHDLYRRNYTYWSI